MELSADVRSEIDHWIAKFPEEQKQSAVIAALTAAQLENGGSLTEEIMDAVAAYLGMSNIAVYEVGSFYSMFDLHPVGRNKISICKNICCMLMGSDDIIDYIENKLDIKVGETTSDGRITLIKEEECLAACGGGPMMVVNGHYHEKLTTETVDQILDGLE